ncbi:hypothetical protein AAMO2058_001298300 [Amorphochlora amoebiformis]
MRRRRLLEGVCEWQRRRVIRPLQRTLRPLARISTILNEAPLLIVLLWTSWYWCVGPRRTIRGIWLVPLCEILNSQLKQYFRHPRPGWIAKYPVKLRQWSAEYSFPSSDMQLVASGCSFLFGDDHPESKCGCV